MKVSILIPTRNEEDHIKKCLESLLRQTYPSQLIEIFVIDGYSEDRTVEIVREYQRYFPSISLLMNPTEYTPHALNMGIKQATGDIIILVGGHSYVHPEFVAWNVKKIRAHRADCVGGRIHPVSHDLTSYLIGQALSCPFGVGNATFRYSTREQETDTVAFGAYRKTVFDKLGGFDEEMIRNQDDEFNYRLKKHGGKIVYCPQIESFYYSRSTLKHLFLQYHQYGYWKVKVMKKINQVPAWRHLIPSIFVLGMSFLIVGALFSLFFQKLLIAFCMIYIVFSIKFSYKRVPAISYFKMILIFFTLHIAYGIGFIQGLWRFSTPTRLTR